MSSVLVVSLLCPTMGSVCACLRSRESGEKKSTEQRIEEIEKRIDEVCSQIHVLFVFYLTWLALLN